MKTLLQNRGGQMKPYSVIDTYNQAVYDICPTLKTTYDNKATVRPYEPFHEHYSERFLVVVWAVCPQVYVPLSTT